MAEDKDHDWADLLPGLDPEEQHQLHDLIEQQRMIECQTEVGLISHNKLNHCADCLLLVLYTTASITPPPKTD